MDRVIALIAALLLAGCGVAPPPGTTALPDAHRMAWEGLQACADCSGIETLLVLEHDEAERRYELTETYLTADGGEPFVETGAWQLQDALLLLEGDAGGARAYGVLADGRLRSHGAGGEAPASGGHVLMPVGGAVP
ncbi:copper resistance protein NlpE N-terminal domain-containing protein [Luteimonas abyssi]|uniref:copper resistance protein NlpE N-terminal domain-containing protein n=1 Tax=Luteimonas abyssi TaxID=1247514 RepID=UPI000737D548|nr:copper resistance protein NlpE N-terminal domain-containing protein [Luteimonas abyssi]